jgi:hypothetical protein
LMCSTSSIIQEFHIWRHLQHFSNAHARFWTSVPQELIARWTFPSSTIPNSSRNVCACRHFWRCSAICPKLCSPTLCCQSCIKQTICHKSNFQISNMSCISVSVLFSFPFLVMHEERIGFAHENAFTPAGEGRNSLPTVGVLSVSDPW